MPQSELMNIMASENEKKRFQSDQKHEDYVLYHPFESEQSLLAESASLLAVKTYFKMLNLSFKTVPAWNAEFMSPGGRKTKLPVLRYGNHVVAEFIPIVEFLEGKGYSLWPEEEDANTIVRQDWHVVMLWVDQVFTNAELYLSWMDEKVLEAVTYPRNGSAFAWPVNHIQNWRKRRQVIRRLAIEDWRDYDMEHVVKEVKKCCKELSERLKDKTYFNGTHPTEFDALVFGHLFSIITMELPNTQLAEAINQRSNLTRFCKNIESQYFARNQTMKEINQTRNLAGHLPDDVQ